MSAVNEATLVHVARQHGQTVLNPMPDNDLELLDGAVDDLGLSRAELLQHTRLVLFVEGPHDQIVLEAYVGGELRRARVRILPMHGTHNAMALADSELLDRLGIPVAVFTDDRVPGDDPCGPPSYAVSRVIRCPRFRVRFTDVTSTRGSPLHLNRPGSGDCSFS